MALKLTHRIDLSKRVIRGKHITNRKITVNAKIDEDSDIITESKIIFCENHLLHSNEEENPLYLNTLADLINGDFDEIKFSTYSS